MSMKEVQALPSCNAVVNKEVSLSV